MEEKLYASNRFRNVSRSSSFVQNILIHQQKSKDYKTEINEKITFFK